MHEPHQPCLWPAAPPFAPDLDLIGEIGIEVD